MKFTRETLFRTLRTFCQSAIAYLVVNLSVIDFSDNSKVVKSAALGLAVSSIAAGLAAVTNLEKGDVNE